ncbi:spore cortex protein [Neisseria sp. Dent CA1/247]|uniref:spore cortex protein n=1 Tax=Neisseria TaxID=482 RepID=UPI001FD3C061|nr:MULTISPECIES: spore cortex protein [Neisseria]MDO5069347.1 spore cortex protein [Neisseria zoodegmatis]UOO77036.1 spore cortex protein [Neisseria sp. Dent CA1/247]
MRHLALFAALAILAGCSWETYQTADGHTALRQKYESGTPVVYQDGTYSRNMRHNQFRPEQRAVIRHHSEQDIRGTRWQKPHMPESSGEPVNGATPDTAQ